MFLSITPRVGLLLALPLFAAVAFAQTPPAKSAAKPAAKPAAAAQTKPAATAKADEKTNTLGGGAGSEGGKLLSREELRACLKQRDELTARVTKLDAERVETNKERELIQAEQGKLKADAETAGGLRPQADDLKTRFEQLKADSDALGKRIADYNENGQKTMSRSQAERERNEINATSEALKAREKTLMAEREALIAKGNEFNAAIKARQEALEARINPWNQNNQRLNRESELLAEERKAWTTDCSNRRYREDDEKAILSGK